MVDSPTTTAHARGRSGGYVILAFLVVAGLTVSYLVGMAGATGPGVLSPDSAFLVAGLAILVLALAVLYLALSYRSSASRLRVHQQAVTSLQQELRIQQATNRERDARLQGAEDRIDGNARSIQETNARFDDEATVHHRIEQRILQVETLVATFQLDSNEDREDLLALRRMINDQADRVTSVEQDLVAETQRAQVTEREIRRERNGSADVGRLEERLERLEAALAVVTADLARHVGHAVLTLEDLDRSQSRREELKAIEGIGDVFQTRLHAQGIETFEQLRAADPVVVAAALQTATKTVQAWQTMAELLEVPGIDPQAAELLVRVGIRSTADLAGSDPDGLVRRIDEFNATHMIRIAPIDVTAEVAAAWIEAAKTKAVVPVSA